MENVVMLPDRDYWKSRKVFITGHTGFKGTWLCLWLMELGAKVTGLSLPLSDENDFFKKVDCESDINHLTGDINNYEQLCAHLKECTPDVIIHFAAQSIVSNGYRDPIGTWQTNLQGSAHILQAVHDVELTDCVVMMATTDKVYKNLEEGRPFKETDPLGGHDPYSASKAGAEILIDSWSKAYCDLWEERSNVLLAVRAGNVIGGGDWSQQRIIPDLARAFSSGEALTVRSPDSIRPWQYVLDVLNGYLCLAQKARPNRNYHGSAWNIGPDDIKGKTVQDVITQALTIWDGKVLYEASPTFKEAEVLLLDNQKILTKVGWSPVLSFGQSVEFTISWYRNAANGNNQRQLSLDDIQLFYQRAQGR